MELEDLKYLWKKNQPDFAAVDEAEIAAMLKRNSKSIVYKLKKSVWFELIFTVVVGVSLLVYALTLPDGALKWTSSSILIVLVVYSFYYVKKLVLLNRFNAVHENIRSNLQRLIENLSGYLCTPCTFSWVCFFARWSKAQRGFSSCSSSHGTSVYCFL
jgi:hypothetical protein